jgi:hypothetical protein
VGTGVTTNLRCVPTGYVREVVGFLTTGNCALVGMHLFRFLRRSLKKEEQPGRAYLWYAQSTLRRLRLERSLLYCLCNVHMCMVVV